MQDTNIEWADQVWNPFRGCSRISPGCGGARGVGGCYAEKIAGRFSGPGLPYEGLVERTKQGWRWNGKIIMVDDKLDEPLHIKQPQSIFVNSMSDAFHPNRPAGSVLEVWKRMVLAHWHTYMILTKRADEMRDWFRTPEAEEARHFAATHGVAWPLPYVWLGTSIESQDYDYRVSELLAAEAALYFVSLEPLLGPVDLSHVPCPTCRPGGVDKRIEDGCSTCTGEGYIDAYQEGLGWVIVGGESGVGARPMEEDWVRMIKDQCDAASVPLFFKQMRVNKKMIKTPGLDGCRYTEKPR